MSEPVNVVAEGNTAPQQLRDSINNYYTELAEFMKGTPRIRLETSADGTTCIVCPPQTGDTL